MKLLRLIPSLDPAAGGTVEAIRQVSPLLAARGVSTTVASLDPPNAPCLAGEGFHGIGLGPGRGVYGYAPGVATAVQRLAASHQAVVIEGLWQYHAFAAWRALRRLGPAAPPYWVYPHGMLDPWFRRTYPLKHLKKWLYWPWADYRVLRDARGVLFTTEQERVLARQSFWLYRARERVAPFGIAPPPADVAGQRAAFVAAFPQLMQRPFLLSLARLHAKKGLDQLIDALAFVAHRHPSLQLILAGPDGGCRAALLAQATRLGVADRVHLPGLLQGPVKWGALRSCSLFCLPSHQENFGIAVAEAMACGRAVLISEAVNLSVDVQAAGAGLVQADTSAATAQALSRWLSMAPAQQSTCHAAALNLFERRYRLDRSVDILLEILSH